MDERKDINSIAGQFRILGEITRYTEVKRGHINDSYLIHTNEPGQAYFLQWVNSYIFKDIEGLMKNIELVTRHIAGKVQVEMNGFKTLELVPSRDGNFYYRDHEGEYWRMYQYIPDTHVYDVVENAAIAYEGGKGFGKFMSFLADLAPTSLTETIPDFHNMEARLNRFHESLAFDKAGRAKEIPVEIKFIENRASSMLEITNLIQDGIIPMRITHNDTKFNNILFNDLNKAVCIVDLDTVMPGSTLFDFGDAIRTGANTVCEDEKNLEKVDINLSIFEAYARGFIRSTLKSLTSIEIEKLAFSARFMTFIIGLRFLTDFLDGDPYFRTNYPLHNLDRARVQFRLIEAMEQKSNEMESIIRKACHNCNQ